MATIYSTGPNENSSAAADDGNISSGGTQGTTSWQNARASAGVSLTVNDSIDGTGSTAVEQGAYAYVRAASVGAGRGVRYHCVRSFYHFDTSSTTACTAVTLDLMGFQGGAYNSGSLIVLKSTAFGQFASAQARVRSRLCGGGICEMFTTKAHGHAEAQTHKTRHY